MHLNTVFLSRTMLFVGISHHRPRMPQRSKKAINQAVSRAIGSRGARAEAETKNIVHGGKRSAAARPKAISQAKGKASVQAGKPSGAVRRATPARRVPPAARKPRAAPASTKLSSRKAGPRGEVAAKRASLPVITRAKTDNDTRTAHALILPPKPLERTPRLAVARAPRAPTVELLPEADYPAPVRQLTSARAPEAPAKACALRMRPRKPRARLTQDTWRQIELAAQRLGRAQLNDEQRVAIRAALEGHDSLVVLPDDERAVTCYQLAALLLDQPTVVVSTQHAELKAQAESLSQRPLAAVTVLPEHSEALRSAAISRIARGGSLLVLLSPEGLRSSDVQQALATSGVALFVAEEAHCASDASH
jgi:hypothetical protein